MCFKKAPSYSILTFTTFNPFSNPLEYKKSKENHSSLQIHAETGADIQNQKRKDLKIYLLYASAPNKLRNTRNPGKWIIISKTGADLLSTKIPK